MALKGDLASVDLAQVFQMLALNQKVGMLSIQSPRSWRALYFDHRGATLYFNEHTMLDRVLAQMTRSGVLMEETVAEAREHAGRMGIPVAESLLAGGFLTEEDLERSIGFEMEEVIYDLFFWNDARFEFHENADTCPEREGVINDRFFFNTDMLIMEAARRIDEWSFIQQRVPSHMEVHRPLPNTGDVMEQNEDSLQVLELIDGKRNVARLIEVSGMAAFHLYKGVATLIESGIIEPTPSNELISSAKECFKEGRLQDAINLFEKSILDGVGIPDAHVLVSDAYEAIGEYELAAYHTKCVAEFRAGEGKTKEALKLFRKVLATITTDLEAQERIVELTVGHPEFKSDDFDPLVAGKNLVDLYLEMGEVDRVRKILEGLLRSNPNDLELKKSLINVHSKAGDTKRVVELYESIADDLSRAGNPIEAVKYLQKIMMIDRSRKDISEKIRALYQLDERRRSRRRSLTALAVTFVLLVVGAIGYYFYDQHSRKHYAQIDLEPLLAEGHYKAAIAILDDFLKDHPFTIVNKEVQADRAKIFAKFEKHKAEVAADDRKRKVENDRLRKAYQSGWSLHEQKFKQGDLVGALKLLERCRQQVEKLAGPQDQLWAEEVKLEKGYQSLKSYLGNAAALDRQVRKAWSDSDWKAARKHVLVLVKSYQMSPEAAKATVPVLVSSRPEGAVIVKDGQPMTVLVDGKQQNLKTPAVVNFPNVLRMSVVLRKSGFADLPVSIEPQARESVGFIMSAVPAQRAEFRDPAQTGAGASQNGVLVVGLEGGNLGIAYGHGKGKMLVSKLPGLSEVVETPAVTMDRTIFVTNEGKVFCHRLDDGSQLWESTPRFGLMYAPVVANGRVFLVDKEGRIFCLSAMDGRELWVQPLQGRVSGRPFVSKRQVLVGSSSGLSVFNAIDGQLILEIPLDVGVTTPTLSHAGKIVFGTTEGYARAVHSDGRQAWVSDVGRAIREDEIVLDQSRGAVILVGADNTLISLSLTDGTVRKKRKFKDRCVAGPLVLGDRVYIVVRERIQEDRNDYRDVLVALNCESFQVQWDFRDGGEFRGSVSTDGSRLFLVGSKGEVLCFP